MRFVKYIFIAWVFSIFISCETSLSQENDLARFKLKGEVKSVIKTTYTSAIKFGEPTKLEKICDGNGFYDRCYIRKFNANGFLTEWVKINNNPSLNRHSYYTYNSNNDLIRYEISTSKKAPIISNYEYEYEDEKVIEKRVLGQKKDLKQKISYQYKDDNLYLIDEFNEKGNLTRRTKYYYDEDKISGISLYDSIGNPTEEIKYDKSEKVKERLHYYEQELLTRYEYKYNDEGKIIEEKEFGSKGLSWLTSYVYNNKGLLIEKQSQGKGAFTKNDITWKEVFEYDNNGNWIKSARYKNNIPHTIAEREIIYYSD